MDGEEEDASWSPSKEGASPAKRKRMMTRKSVGRKYNVDKEEEDDGDDMKEEVVIINVTDVERKRLHDAHFQRVKDALKKLENEWNEKVVSQAKGFLEKAEQILLNKTQISTTPVAFVPSGLSTEEDKETFNMIEAEVIKYTSLVTRISGFKCSNVKIAFQTICKQLDSPSSSTPRALKENLASRFEEEDTPEILAVIVEKAEFFSKNVFPQLLQLLSTADFPLLFIVGVSHCVGNFSRFIPPNCSTAFVYTEFETVSTTQRLNQVFYTILDADLGPFTLDGKIVKFLSHYFMSQHASVARLFQAYRICLLEHYRKPESILCRIPSNTKQSDYLSDERFAKAAAVEGITSGKIMAKASIECWSTMVHWNFILRIISFVQASLQSKSSDDTFTELYISCSQGSFFEPTLEGDFQSPYRRFLEQIKTLAKSGLSRVIYRLCWDLGLEDNTEGFIHQKSDLYLTKTKVPEIIGLLENIKDELDQLDEKEKENKPVENNSPLQQTLPQTRLKLNKIMKREDLKQMLRETIASTSTSKPLNDLRESFIQFIENLVKLYLKPLPSILKGVHYKAIVVDDLIMLKSLFSPDPLSLLTNSLIYPSQILDCKCCEDVSSTSNVPSLPDSSIIFKLLKEQTNKKVDLNSLFQAFLSILETEQEGNRRRASIKLRKLDENSCLLRFRQSLAELQFTGVLKRSRTNPDEITKLIW